MKINGYTDSTRFVFIKVNDDRVDLVDNNEVFPNIPLPLELGKILADIMNEHTNDLVRNNDDDLIRLHKFCRFIRVNNDIPNNILLELIDKVIKD